VVQPIVGYLSDRTWNRLGRRRPYFLTGAILASLALIVMPNSPALWVAAGMLWIMDASINISMEPFRAFVGDNLPASQRVTGFALQSLFIGTGAVVASALPPILTLLGVSNEAPAGQIPTSVRLSFYLGAIAFFVAVLWTVLWSKEYPPDVMTSFADNQSREEVIRDARTPEEYARNGRKQIGLGVASIAVGAILSAVLWSVAWYQVLVLSVGIMVFGALLIGSGTLQQGGQTRSGFVTIMNDLLDMPGTMKQLAWAQFFSWFALFALWIYTTAAVTNHIYHSSDTTTAAYNDGANWINI